MLGVVIPADLYALAPRAEYSKTEVLITSPIIVLIAAGAGSYGLAETSDGPLAPLQLLNHLGMCVRFTQAAVVMSDIPIELISQQAAQHSYDASGDFCECAQMHLS